MTLTKIVTSVKIDKDIARIVRFSAAKNTIKIAISNLQGNAVTVIYLPKIMKID